METAKQTRQKYFFSLLQEDLDKKKFPYTLYKTHYQRYDLSDKQIFDYLTKGGYHYSISDDRLEIDTNPMVML